jgi:uncharacterized protein (DUF169 family)
MELRSVHPKEHTMYWQQWSERLRSELELSTHPVAVSMGGPLASELVASQGRVSVCQALQRAGQGETLYITSETCGCAGGLTSLGLGQSTAEGRERLVNFLVTRERVYCSRVAMHRSRETVRAPVGVASHVVFAPLSAAKVLPDIVAFLGTPGSLHHLIGLAAYWDGMSMKAELGGPTCRTGIAYPIVTGQIGLSLFDHGARRLADFPQDTLVVSVPLHRMFGIMQALDQGDGSERIADREQMERQIDELGKVAQV